MPVKKLTRIALLAAILYISQVLLAFIANVELVSMLTILFTMVFGKEALLIVTVFNFLELIHYGPGLWVVSYFYTWPVLVLLTLLVKKIFKEEFILWSIFSGLFGLLFGAFFAIAYLPVDRTYALTYWIQGLPWDVWHAAANFVIMLVLGKPAYQVLRRLKQQTDV